MQEVKIYVAASSAVGVVRDYANARNASLPSLVRGVKTCLKLRLFETTDGNSPYPIEQLRSVSAWKFVMDKDFDEETNYILQADNDNITISTATDTIIDTVYTYTEVSIPLLETNTVELDNWLHNDKSKSGLSAELCGYDANGNSVFVLQLENFTVRNRLTSAGEPTELPSNFWSEAQVRAYVTNYVDVAVKNAVKDELVNGEW